MLISPPVRISNTFEYSVHKCPVAMVDELRKIFGDYITEDLLVIPTFQKAALDLCGIGPQYEDEKNRLLEVVRRLRP